MLKPLLELQEIDLEIEACKAREVEIPKQKGKFDIYRKRLAAELEERKEACQKLVLEQRECESDIEQRQQQITKYNQQLNAVKKNEEYQALLHEIELLNKQIGIKEERIISIMMEMDDAQARLEEDRKRINDELKDIEAQCATIDGELAEVVREREALEAKRQPLEEKVDAELMARYKRIRNSKRTGAAVVPLTGESCSGCYMSVRPQIVNEILAGHKVHACAHCGRLLYNPENGELG